MSNIILTQIKDPNNKQLIVFSVDQIKPTSGRTDTIYYQRADNQCFYWDGSAYQTLIGTTTVSFVDTYSNLPSTGQSSDIVYITEDYERVYEWTGIDYVYVKDLSNIVIQLTENTTVKYNSPAVPPSSLKINIRTAYIVGYDGRSFISDTNGRKTYLNINSIITYFKPLNQKWTDIFGNYIPPEPPTIPSDTDEKVINALKGVWDTNNDNYIDYSSDSGKLNGKTGGYYLGEIAKKANQTDLDTTNVAVVQKADKIYVDELASTLTTKTENNLKTNKSGDTMTGDLNMENESAILFGGRFRISRNKSLDSLDFDLI